MASGLRQACIERAVATTHGHEVWWARVPATRQMLRRIGDRTDVVTYLGEYTRSRIAAALTPAAAARMVRLTPGVDDTLFHPGAGGTEVRARHGLGERPVVVCVSRVVARKGQDVLVRALPEIRRRVPGAALLIVGDGPHLPAVRRLASRLARAGDVVLAGGSVPGRSCPPITPRATCSACPAGPAWAGWSRRGWGFVTWRPLPPGCRWWRGIPVARRTPSLRGRPGSLRTGHQRSPSPSR